MRQPDEDAGLAAFQAALLDLLDQRVGSEELLRRLRTDPRMAPYRAYLDTFEPRMVEVATALLAKWGVRIVDGE